MKIGLLCCCFTLLLAGGSAVAQTAEQRQYLGVSSCMATACHGSPQETDRPAWQSAYTVWSAQDPHSNASFTLLNDQSRQIVRIILGEDTSLPAHMRVLSERCIGCHATPTIS